MSSGILLLFGFGCFVWDCDLERDRECECFLYTDDTLDILSLIFLLRDLDRLESTDLRADRLTDLEMDRDADLETDRE